MLKIILYLTLFTSEMTRKNVVNKTIGTSEADAFKDYYLLDSSDGVIFTQVERSGDYLQGTMVFVLKDELNSNI